MTLAELLQPISANNPGGEDISGDNQFIQLTQALRPRIGPPNYDQKPNYELAESLAEDLLTKRSKDLQVAAMYTEALLVRQDYAGLRLGLEVLHGLLDKFWDTAFPTNPVQRRGPLATLGSEDFAIQLQLRPLSEAGHSYWDYRQGSSMPRAEEANSDPEKSKQREAMLADGKISPEMFDVGVADTSRKFYRELSADLDGSLQAVQALDAIGKTRFGAEAPSYRVLRMAIESVSKLVKELLGQKPPDPDEVSTPESEATTESGDGPELAAATGGRAGATVADVNDAENRVVSAAHYLRKLNPRSPTPYLLLRTFRWGELRDGEGTLDEKLLIAPRPEMRSQLRSLYLEGRWENLLEATEQIVGSRVGRGWIDLQYYAVHACEALGDPYNDVRSAIVGALRTLLADVPSLPRVTLMDAMPTATPETSAWIANHVLAGAEAAPQPATRDMQPEHRPGRDVYAAAQLEATSGKPERAIELLMRELARETTERARFLRRIQIASIMVEKGLFGVATPLLNQLIAQIDKFSLADWEDGNVVAQPLILMIRCLDARNDETSAREEYYLRVCTLSPVDALALTKS